MDPFLDRACGIGIGSAERPSDVTELDRAFLVVVAALLVGLGGDSLGGGIGGGPKGDPGSSRTGDRLVPFDPRLLEPRLGGCCSFALKM